MKKAQKKHVKFTFQEDELLKELVEREGPHKWNKIAIKMPGRTAKQCRDRFQNYLNPSLINDKWTVDEDQLLFQKIKEYGKKWKLISQFFPTRSHNNVKNRYNSRKYLKSNETDNLVKEETTSQEKDKTQDDSGFDENLSQIFDDAQLCESICFDYPQPDGVL